MLPLVLVGALAGCSRVTGLPDVPASVTAREAGIDDLDALAKEAAQLRAYGAAPAREAGPPPAIRAPAATTGTVPAPPAGALGKAWLGLALVAVGADAAEDRGAEGLRLLTAAVEERPSDLVIGNAFRMSVYRLQRRALAASKARGERNPMLPGPLRSEPLATLERAAARSPGREIRLQVAFSYVDRMVLNPALEIKAPASIDSVHALTAILDQEPHYVPALVARGLNHLYRPRNLVWPEHPAPPPDAASRDLGLAAAVGQKVGGAPARLKGILLTLLGDAHAVEGKVGIARSWWVLARETSDDPAVREAVAARMTWRDDEAAGRLEDSFEDRMADEDDPVSDLSFLWGAARGPL